MKILTNAQANRKELVASLTELLNEKPRYDPNKPAAGEAKTTQPA